MVLIDASEELSEQDVRIIAKVIESGRGLVLALNKWDLVDEDRRYMLDREYDRDLAHVAWAPRVNIGSAQPVPQGSCRFASSPGAWWQATEDPVRHSGVDRATDFCALHVRIPRGKLPPIHRAAAPRGVRIRGQPGSR